MASPHWQRILSEKLRALSYSNTPDALPQELARALFQPGGRYVSSMTRLETYRSCPYKYFLQYGLALEARDEGEIQSLDLGNYLHAGLHQFGSTLTLQKGSGATPVMMTSARSPPPSQAPSPKR